MVNDRVPIVYFRIPLTKVKTLSRLMLLTLIVPCPVPVVEPLSKQFDRRLGSVRFSNRHVDIVGEDDRTFSDRRPVNALSSLVQLRHDDVLNLVCGCLGAKVENVGFVDFLVELLQQKFDDVTRFAGTGRTDEKARLVVCNQHVHQHPVTGRIDRLDNDFVEGCIFRDGRKILEFLRKRNPPASSLQKSN